MLQDVARGDEQAFARLFHAYRDKLYGFILKITGSRELAEDVVQDVFLKIWTHRSNLHEVENFNAYLFRMSHNQVMNGLKRMNLESSIRLRLARLVQAAAEDPESVLMYKHTRELLKEAVEQLPPQQKLVYQLSREQGLKQEEIANQLNISAQTVKNHMSQALRSIRERIGRARSHDLSYLFLLLVTGIF